ADAFGSKTKLLSGNAQIFRVLLEADETRDGALPRGECGMADAEEWIEHHSRGVAPVKVNAHFRERDGKCRGMRAIGRAALDCFVRHKPRVALAAFVASAG